MKSNSLGIHANVPSTSRPRTQPPISTFVTLGPSPAPRLTEFTTHVVDIISVTVTFVAVVYNIGYLVLTAR